MKGPRIAFSHRFRECPGVRVLRALPNFNDYDEEEKKLIREAEKVYYPTKFYVDLFITLGKKIFPSRESYVYSGDKIRQTALFQFLGLPHPRTKIFFGAQKKTIPEEFPFPFIAKIPRGSSLGKGVYLVHNQEELNHYLHLSAVAYIQEYIPLVKDLRVILIQHRIILAYWKIARSGEFRNNLAQGASVAFENIPRAALDFAGRLTRLCNFDDVGLDLCHSPDKGWLVLEANMNYGQQALLEKGLPIRQVLRELLEEGVI